MAPPARRRGTGARGGGYGFGALWLGQSISLAGTQIGALALPLVAVVSLHAGADQLGVLGALRYLPFLLLALPLGPLIDRGDRRRLMLVADWARAGLVAAVPVLHFAGFLTVWWLFAVAFGLGAFQVLFDSAYLSFVPQLVSRERLTRANRNLQASQSVAELGGPGLGGAVVAAVGAPAALLLDAVSFVASALALSVIRVRLPVRADRRREPGARRPGEILAAWWSQAREGLAFVARRPELRALAIETAAFNAFEQGVLTIYLVYAIRELGFSAVLLGASLAASGIGALLGTLLSEPASRRFGLGPTITVGSALGAAAFLLVPAAGGGRAVVFCTVSAGFALAGIATGISNVLQLSLRQASTPDRLLGRMNASFRFVAYGMLPLGPLLGGVLGELIGLRPALWVMAAGLLLGPLAVACSPVPRRRALPAGEQSTPAVDFSR